MRKLVITLLLLLVAAGLADPRGYATIISSFSTSAWSGYPNGIGYDGSNLWITDSANAYMYKVTTTGSLISSANLAPITVPIGISWDGSAFWVNGMNGPVHNFYHVNTSGSTLSSITGVLSYPFPFDVKYLTGNVCWVSSDYYDRVLYQHDMTTGSIISSFVTTAKYPCGLCWDGTYLLVTGSIDGITYRYTTTGSCLSSFLSPIQSSDYVGSTVWVGSNMYEICTSQNMVYCLSVDWNPPGTEPTSLGVIRTFYH